MSENFDNIPLLNKLNNYGENGTNTSLQGMEIGKRLRGYTGLIDLLPEIDAPAFRDPNNLKEPLSHKRLKKFVSEDFDLRKYNIPYGARVAIVLPNGPELAICVASTIARWCTIPINSNYTWNEIKWEMQNTGAVAVIYLDGDASSEAATKAAEELNAGIICIKTHPTVTGIFSMRLVSAGNTVNLDVRKPAYQYVKGWNNHFDHPEIVFLLHTSGTSGNKKLVPYSLDMMIIGVGSIVSGWNLNPNDVVCNMMPLFHIGGIMRNVLSPLLSGGSIIACKGFDPILFWDVLSQQRVTWYYASPTMHHGILNEASVRPQPLPVGSVRFLANAAGALLPVLAKELLKTFDCVILTSYGMTECMPISTPPQTYKLDPTGTSGIPMGPEVCICDDHYNRVEYGVTGNIMVRGPPCFGGYENNDNANDESFFTVDGKEEGWFNTGDRGCLDSNNYLFISGRSKEIINKGGETISPFEIEEVVVQHPYVKETIAFSAPHREYQETVGCVIVTIAGKPRVDLASLHKYLDGKLHRSKWPHVIVYSKALPKNATNKVQRIKYANRTKMPEIDETAPMNTRLYEGETPPQGAPMTTPIPISPVIVDFNETKRFLLNKDGHVVEHHSIKIIDVEIVCINLPQKHDATVALITFENAQSIANPKEITDLLTDYCETKLDNYLAPDYIMYVSEIPSYRDDYDQLCNFALALYQETNIVTPRNEMEVKIENIWRECLSATSTLSVTSNFFDIGGDSLKAGLLINTLRKKLKVQLSVADLFTAPTIELMAKKLESSKTLNTINNTVIPYGSVHGSQEKMLDDDLAKDNDYFSYHYFPSLSNTTMYCLIVQLIPILIIAPLRRIIIWFLICWNWAYLQSQGISIFNALIIAILITRVQRAVILPTIGIIAKWSIIGRYKAGKYPLWSGYYLKWWLVDQIIKQMGPGIFRAEIPIIGQQLMRFYYRIMGAYIGENVKFAPDAQLSEFDLIHIEDGSAIDSSKVQPFGLEEGHFVLLPINLGKNCCVGMYSVVAPGSYLKPGHCIGPRSSSYAASDPDSRKYCTPLYASPPNWMIILIGIPILALVRVIALLPWYGMLQWMASTAIKDGWYPYGGVLSVYEAFKYWMTPERLPWFFALRVINRCVSPFIKFFVVVIIKWTIIGKFKPLGPKERLHPWNVFRVWLMSRLWGADSFQPLAKLVGTHYETISRCYRLLGAKIGKNVYWPGSGFHVAEYDLLEIQDNVVFGSRTKLKFSTMTESKKIVFEEGTMIADRCCILPGGRLKRGSILGSGGLCKEDFEIPTGSVWVGSVDGNAIMVSPPDLSYETKDVTSPFALAFYEGLANYWVIPQWLIFVYSWTWMALVTCYRNALIVISLIVGIYLMNFDNYRDSPSWELFRITFCASIPAQAGLVIISLAIDIGGKWLLMGQRQQGKYLWTESSYCQRWQLYLTLGEIIRSKRKGCGIKDMLQGSQYLVWYFRALGANIGNNVCLYPRGADPMLTEPDLVTIEDFAAVDNASLIAHINTRGQFALNPLRVGTCSVMKTNTRLLSGGTMESHSMLLEHTLVMGGETVDTGTVWQGWPTQSQISLHQHRRNLQTILDKISIERFYRNVVPTTSTPFTLSTRNPINPSETFDSYNSSDDLESQVFPVERNH